MKKERINPPPPRRRAGKEAASGSVPAATPSQPVMSKAAADLAAQAAKRTLARRKPIAVKLDGNKLVQPDDMDERVAQHLRLCDTFGTASGNFMAAAIGALGHSAAQRAGDEASETVLNASIALVDAIRPENELEAALAVQMAGCHLLAAEMLGRARASDRTDHLQLYGNLAVKLQRTFTAQIEALGRMRGDASQSVRVEHVHVHEGGQAIVGNVQSGGPPSPT